MSRLRPEGPESKSATHKAGLTPVKVLGSLPIPTTWCAALFVFSSFTDLDFTGLDSIHGTFSRSRIAIPKPSPGKKLGRCQISAVVRIAIHVFVSHRDNLANPCGAGNRENVSALQSGRRLPARGCARKLPVDANPEPEAGLQLMGATMAIIAAVLYTLVTFSPLPKMIHRGRGFCFFVRGLFSDLRARLYFLLADTGNFDHSTTVNAANGHQVVPVQTQIKPNPHGFLVAYFRC